MSLPIISISDSMLKSLAAKLFLYPFLIEFSTISEKMLIDKEITARIKVFLTKLKMPFVLYKINLIAILNAVLINIITQVALMGKI